MRVLRRRKEIADFQRIRRGITGRNVERQTIGENAPRVNEGDGVVANCIMVELASCKTIWRKEKARERELNRVFEIAGLRLEMVLRQVHPLVPDNA